jgi:glycosyltransferase involved in cell wall biosynthesis
MSLSEQKPAAAETLPDRLCLAWKSECFRTLQTAYIFRAPLVLIRPQTRGGKLGSLLRYSLSSLQTIRVLLQRRPRVLAVLNQPLPLALIAAIYARLTGAKLILDGHSKPYAAKPGSLYGKLYRWVTRAAVLTVNHNDEDAVTVREWGGRSVVFEALPFVLPVALAPAAPSERPYVVFVCSFAPDEPIEVIMEAVRRVAPLDVRITGAWRKSGLTEDQLPSNLTPTGFLPTQAYYELFAGAAAVATLSHRSWIMQMAIEEALLMGVPAVTNFSPVLEKVLGRGAAFTTLEAEPLAAAIQDVVDHRARYEAEIKAAGAALRARVSSELAGVESLLSS